MAYTSTISILNIINPQSPDQQRHALLTQMYIFTWALHVIATIFIAKWQVGGFYFFTAWHLSVFVGSVCDARERASAWLSAECSQGQDDPADAGDSSVGSGQPTERTPLIASRGTSDRMQGDFKQVRATTSEWWLIPQLLTLVAPITLMSQLVVLVVDALGQTFSDGSNPAMGRNNLFSVVFYRADSFANVSIWGCSPALLPHCISHSAPKPQNTPLGLLHHPSRIDRVYRHILDRLPIHAGCAPYSVFPTTHRAGSNETNQPDSSRCDDLERRPGIYQTCCGLAAPFLVGCRRRMHTRPFQTWSFIVYVGIRLITISRRQQQP